MYCLILSSPPFSEELNVQGKDRVRISLRKISVTFGHIQASFIRRNSFQLTI